MLLSWPSKMMSAINGEMDNFYISLVHRKFCLWLRKKSIVLDKIGTVSCNRKWNSKRWIKLGKSVVFNLLSLLLLPKRCFTQEVSMNGCMNELQNPWVSEEAEPSLWLQVNSLTGPGSVLRCIANAQWLAHLSFSGNCGNICLTWNLPF